MKTIIPTDRNTFFNVRRERLQSLRRPLIRENTIPESYKKTGVYYDEKSWQPFPKFYGGQDKNIFFQVPIRKEPFLRKRVIKDLEPSSRIIGKLALTKEERQAEAVLKGINAIGQTLDQFLSTPVVGIDGLAMVDPITNKPIIKKRSLQEVLQASIGSIDILFKTLNIPMTVNMATIINQFTEQQARELNARAGDIVKAQPDLPEAERNELVKKAAVGELMANVEDVKTPEAKAALINEVIDQKLAEGDQKLDGYPEYVSPRMWTAMNKDERNDLRYYILTREVKENDRNIRFRTFTGTYINLPHYMQGESARGVGLTMGSQFTRDDRYLDMNTLRFKSRAQVPQVNR